MNKKVFPCSIEYINKMSGNVFECCDRNSPDDADLEMGFLDGPPRPRQKLSTPSKRPGSRVPVDPLGSAVPERLCLRIDIAVGVKQRTRGPRISFINEKRVSNSFLLHRCSSLVGYDCRNIVEKNRA